jgi:hypothetical protein
LIVALNTKALTVYWASFLGPHQIVIGKLHYIVWAVVVVIMWIYNYLCNQCLSPLTLWVRIPFMRGVLDTTLCDKVCLWLSTGQWFFPSTTVSSTNKSDCHRYNWNIVDCGIKHQSPNPDLSWVTDDGLTASETFTQLL